MIKNFPKPTSVSTTTAAITTAVITIKQQLFTVRLVRAEDEAKIRFA